MKKFIIGLTAAVLAFGFGAQGVAMASAEEATATHVTEAPAKASGLAPFAWYTFGSEEEIGKDKMGRFDLVQKVSGQGGIIIQEDTDGSKYAAFRKNKNVMDPLPDFNANVASAGGGVSLYALPIGETTQDFSDLISGSYTVSCTVRCGYTAENYGSSYIMSVGRYNDAFTMSPWCGGMVIQTETWHTRAENADQGVVDSSCMIVEYEDAEWATLTVVGDSERNEVRAYLNGTLAQTRKVPSVHFTNSGKLSGNGGGYDYVFSLGSAASIGGGGCTNFADMDIKDCKVFDYAVSEENVTKLCAGEETTYVGTTVEALPELNTADIDFEVTDQNPIEEIVAKMPKSAVATLSDGSKSPVSLTWTVAPNQADVIGVIDGKGIANVKGLGYTYETKTVVKFTYDKNKVTISELKIKGKDGNPDISNVLEGEEATSQLTVSFKIEPVGDNKIAEILANDYNEFDQELWETEDHTVYIRILKGVHVVVTMEGDVVVNPEDPEDPDLDSDSNEDKKDDKKEGCGSVTALSASVAGIALAALAILKKRAK